MIDSTIVGSGRMRFGGGDASPIPSSGDLRLAVGAPSFGVGETGTHDVGWTKQPVGGATGLLQHVAVAGGWSGFLAMGDGTATIHLAVDFIAVFHAPGFGWHFDLRRNGLLVVSAGAFETTTGLSGVTPGVNFNEDVAVSLGDFFDAALTIEDGTHFGAIVPVGVGQNTAFLMTALLTPPDEEPSFAMRGSGVV